MKEKLQSNELKINQQMDQQKVIFSPIIAKYYRNKETGSCIVGYTLLTLYGILSFLFLTSIKSSIAISGPALAVIGIYKLISTLVRASKNEGIPVMEVTSAQLIVNLTDNSKNTFNIPYQEIKNVAITKNIFGYRITLTTDKTIFIMLNYFQKNDREKVLDLFNELKKFNTFAEKNSSEREVGESVSEGNLVCISNDLTEGNEYALRTAVKCGDSSKSKQLKLKGTNIDIKDEHGKTAYMMESFDSHELKANQPIDQQKIKYDELIRTHSLYKDDRFNRYAHQLIDIYRKHGSFLGSAENEVRTVGEILNNEGGFDAMKMICEGFYHNIGAVPYRQLEKAWHGIGRWLG